MSNTKRKKKKKVTPINISIGNKFRGTKHTLAFTSTKKNARSPSNDIHTYRLFDSSGIGIKS